MSEPASSEFICRISAGNTITAAGENWRYLLRPDSSDDATPPPYLGKMFWLHLSDSTTMHLLEALVAKARRTGEELSIPFLCELPGRRLYLELRCARTSAGSIEFCATAQREESITQDSGHHPRRFTKEFVRICGWCKRIATPDWMDVDVAIRKLKLLESDELMRVTHSICPDCAQRVIQETWG